MQRWLNEATHLVSSLLGASHTPVQRSILAVFGLLALLGVMKLFTQASLGRDAGWPRRILAAFVFLSVILVALVATRLYLNPHLTSLALRKVAMVAVPVLCVLAIAIPLMSLLMRVDYVGALIGTLTSAAACAVVIMVVGAFTDSFSGGNKSFSKLRKHAVPVDSFIER